MALVAVGDGDSNRKKRKSEVLSEEEYVDRLEAIIERDFFPQLPQMRAMLAYLKEHDTYDLSALRRTYRQLFPTLPSPQDDGEGKDKLSIAEFFNKYISEDNSSFLDLQQRSIEEHRAKYHWMYEALDNAIMDAPSRRPGMLMLYYIGNRLLTAGERQEVDRILNGEADFDQRPNSLSTWAFRVRNQLMFPPVLEDSMRTCGVPVPVPAYEVKMIADFPFQAPAPRIQRQNCTPAGVLQEVAELDAYLRGHGHGQGHGQGQQPSPYEDPHTPSTVCSNDGEYSSMPHRGRVGAAGYREVAMSPAPVPGRGPLASPLMTWGTVPASPLRLDITSEEVPVAVAGPRFSLQGPGVREQRARDLLDKTKRRPSSSSTSSGALGPSSTPMSMSSLLMTPRWKYSDSAMKGSSSSGASVSGGHSVSSNSHSHSNSHRPRLADMSPAAQRLAKKLSSQQLPAR